MRNVAKILSGFSHICEMIDELWDKNDVYLSVYRKNSDGSIVLHGCNQYFLKSHLLNNQATESALSQLYRPEQAQLIGRLFEHYLPQNRELSYICAVTENEPHTFWQVTLRFQAPFIICLGCEIPGEEAVRHCETGLIETQLFGAMLNSSLLLSGHGERFQVDSIGEQRSLFFPQNCAPVFQNSPLLAGLCPFLSEVQAAGVPTRFLTSAGTPARRRYCELLLLPLPHSEQDQLLVFASPVSEQEFIRRLANRCLLIVEKAGAQPYFL